MYDNIALLCGSVENETDVRDLFDLVICLVVDGRTLRDRLQTRTTHPFGRHPEELATLVIAACIAAESERGELVAVRERRAGEFAHFQAINGEHGHETGDVVPAETAYRMRATLRA